MLLQHTIGKIGRNKLNIKELRLSTGMERKEFAEYFNIPYRTLQNWELELREAPEYVAELIEYKIKKENDEMNKIDKMILEVKELQDLLNHRTKIENQAIKLIEECKFEEAIELLATI